MVANGGGPPFVKKRDEEFNSNNYNPILIGMNNNNKNSIANRRAENCGFNASSLSPCMLPSFITVSPGISPSELLGSPIDSPIMLPNAQAQASPTTGRCSSPSYESARLCSGDSSSIDSIAGRIIFECANEIMMQKEEAPPVEEEYSEYLIAKTGECKNWWEIECMQEQEQEQEGNCKINNRNNNKLLMLQPPNQEQKQQQQQKCWDDGYSWRKYGQKQVKGSEFPRSYYKCTSSNCDVTKKVERSLDGQISEIVYKGSHNHPPVSKPNNNDLELSAEDEPPDPPPPPPTPIFNVDHTQQQQQQQLDHSPNADQVSPQNHELLGGGGGEDEHMSNDPKRRKIRESLGAAGPSHETSATARSGREPKVVFQIKSEIDILEDGYRWRKYGQKVVKGNPNPRSYYKCTTPDCFVRKHVERAANDIESVVTTYEGKHNHKVPNSRNSTSSAICADNVTVPLTNPTTISTPMPMPVPIPMPHKSARVRDQRPLYLQERKPILNYNEFMTSNLATNFRPPIYPYSFSTGFHSLPTYTSTPFIMNNNIPMNNYPVVNPDCMSISSMTPINHISGSSSNVSIDHIPSFQYNNYVAPMQPPSNQGHEIKEEPLDHGNKVIYDDHIFQSLPDHEN